MNSLLKYFLLFFVFPLQICCSIEEDPLLLPAGVKDCNPTVMQSDRNPRVGNFSVFVDGNRTIGVARALFQNSEDSSAGFILEVFREDCFGLAKILINTSQVYSQDTIHYNYINSRCDNEVPNISTSNYLQYAILDDDFALASYNAPANQKEAYLQITEVNLPQSFLRGKFGGSLCLDTLCFNHEGYPDTLILENGEFIASIFKSQ